MARINPTGHTALYFDHICAASYTELRRCAPGELGAVISRYDDMGGLDWVAMPLIPYLYSVDTADQIPLSMDRITLHQMRESYRRTHLQSLAPSRADGSAPEGNWYELVGSAYDRAIYGFQVKTTSEQDDELIQLMNDRKNEDHYNGAFRNCADFVRVTVNRLYPHAIRRNFIADFGLTTPKSVARAITHYAKKHPEIGLAEFQIPQVPGWLPRSRKPVGVTEGLVKLYGLPLILLSPATTTVVLIAYLGQGRFSEPRHAPVLDVRALSKGNAGENGAALATAAVESTSLPPTQNPPSPQSAFALSGDGSSTTPVNSATPAAGSAAAASME